MVLKDVYRTALSRRQDGSTGHRRVQGRSATRVNTSRMAYYYDVTFKTAPWPSRSDINVNDGRALINSVSNCSALLVVRIYVCARECFCEFAYANVCPSIVLHRRATTQLLCIKHADHRTKTNSHCSIH